MLKVSVAFGVVGVGNPETIHPDNFSYAFSSNTRGELLQEIHKRSWEYTTHLRRYIPRHVNGC